MRSLAFLYICIFGIVPSTSRLRNEKMDFTSNSSLTLSHILKTYDVRLRPNFGAQPLYIGMELLISSVDEFSEVNMDYTITISLNQYWKDERLAFSSQDIVLPLTGDFAEKIWVPDTFFANDKNSFLHDVTEKNKMIRLYGDGSIAYGMRFTTTLICPMNLVSYPLDSQNCTVEIESYGYTTRDLYFYWKTVSGLEQISLHQYAIADYNMIDRLVELQTGTYQRLSLSILFKRNIGSFIFQMYLPSVLIVMISWISFWINFDAPAARVALGITTILTLLISHNNVRSTLPKISYVKAIDIYLVTCFFFVFAALIEYAAVNYTYWENISKKGKTKTEKRKSRWKRSVIFISSRWKRNRANFGETSSKLKIPKFKQRFWENNRNKEKVSSTAIPTITSTMCSIEIGGEEAEPQGEVQSKGLLSTSPSGSRALLPEPTSSQLYHSQGKVIRSSSFCGATELHPISRPSPTTSQTFDLCERLSPSRAIPTRRKRFMQSMRRKVKRLKKRLPQFSENVNHIDTFARIVFPLSFLAFNAIYWMYFILNA